TYRIGYASSPTKSCENAILCRGNVKLLNTASKGETGIVTVFNRNFGILYSEQLYGSPTLEGAKLSFSSL
ncbi:MAG: hypothetical protein FWF80_08580, partial [Defluviitaleaceae bacterium]|nr:hypothetical protein [Defluviitaleaceae bacterium]